MLLSIKVNDLCNMPKRKAGMPLTASDWCVHWTGIFTALVKFLKGFNILN